MRGVDGTGPAQGADAFFAGVRPRLNYQIDGRTLSYNEAIFSDASLFDVDHVEVYRGPQSTLQGRNAIAGAIVIKTKDPTWDFEAGGKGEIGNYDLYEVGGYVSGPIVDDQLAARVSAKVLHHQSPIDFTPYTGVPDPRDYYDGVVRAKLLFQPAALSGFSTLLTLSHSKAHAPQDSGVVRPFADQMPAFPEMPRFGTRADTLISETKYQISDGLSFDAVISTTDLGVNRWATEGGGNARIDAGEFVAEPRLQFTALDGQLTGFGGVHIFRSSQNESIDLFGGGTFDDKTRTNALFGEATYRFSDAFDVTAGGRLEREERHRTGGSGPFLIAFDETYKVFLPKVSAAFHASENLTVGATISRGYNGGGAGFTYDPPFVSYIYKPEFVWNYEAFLRTNLDDDRITLTTNVFFNRYRDLQLPFDLNPDPAIWSYVVRNADEAKTYGAEAKVKFALDRNVSLFADLGLLQTDVTRYPGSGIEGNDLARSPAFTFDLGGNYVHESGFGIGADLRFSDAYYTEVTDDPRGKTDPYAVVNAQIAYNFGKARVYLSAHNLFDSIKPVLLYPGDLRADDTANTLMPRTVRAGVEFRI